MSLVTPRSAARIIDTDVFQLDVGGAESNVTSHLAQLGIAAAWASRLGNDFLGDRILRTLRRRGVDTTLVEQRTDAATAVYVKDPGNGVLYYRTGSAASTMDRTFALGLPLDGVEFVHVTGITPALSPACLDMVEMLFERVRALPHVTLSFDVNFRRSLWSSLAEGARALLSLARRADLVFVGLDEARALWGSDTVDDVRALIPEPERLVVKNDAIGATEYLGTKATFMAALPVQVVEPVGAGDAFAAGYLAAALEGEGSAERLTRGHRRAALVLQSTSDFVTEG